MEENCNGFNLIRGIFWGILFSVPLWAVIIWLLLLIFKFLG